MRPRFLDFSFQRPTAGQIAAADRDARTYVGVVLPPLSWFDDCDAAGVGVEMIFEMDSARSLEGYNAGVLDAQFAIGRTRGVGRTHVAYAVSDHSAGDPSAGGDAITGYGQAIGDTHGQAGDVTYEFYGNRYAVDAATAGARASSGAHLLVAGPSRDGGWLPGPWGADAARDTASQDANDVPPIDGTDDNTRLNFTPPLPTLEEPMGFIRRASDGHTEWTNGWSFYWDPDGAFEALPAAAVDPLPDAIWDQAHADAAGRQAQLTAAAGDAVPTPPLDVNAVVAAVLADYDTLTNANERSGLEASLRAHLSG